jgi:hypothetical protein
VRSIVEVIRGTLTTKASVAAAAIVVVGGGAAIAAPGFGTASDDDVVEIVQELPSDEENLQLMADACAEEYEGSGVCNGGSYHDEVPEDEEEGPEEELDDPEDGEGAQGFSEWVRSLPSDWGCIRGQLVSYAARQGPHSGAHEELDFETATEAAEFLGIKDRRCAEVAIAKADGEATADEDLETQEAGDSRGGPPAHAGRPDHAGGPKGEATTGRGNGRGNGNGPPPHAGPKG